MKNEDQELEAGFAFDEFNGISYQFSHISTNEAHRLIDITDQPHVIETINLTTGNGNPDQVHHNRYFCLNLSQAIGKAADMQIAFFDVAEMIISIRPATSEEIEIFMMVEDRFRSQMPAAISNEEAGKL